MLNGDGLDDAYKEVFELPYPPTVNTYYRNVSINGKRRTLISARGREYRADVIRAIGKGVVSLNSRLRVEIKAFMPDRRRRDLDNLGKSICDSMTHAGVWIDDEQIDDLRFIRAGVEAPGRVIVTVTQIN